MLLIFDFKTVEEAKEFLAGLNYKPQAAGVDFGMAPAMVLDLKTVVLPRLAEDSVLLPNLSATEVRERFLEAPPKKRGRPAKAVPGAEREVKEYDIEDCRTALSNLFDTKGREVAKTALAEFKAARVTDLKPAQYRGFIVLCETLGQPE